MKRKIRLTEGDLHRIVKESTKRILNEVDFFGSDRGQFMAGRLSRRNNELDASGNRTKMRKNKDKYPVFNHAEKASKKIGVPYNKHFSNGYQYQRDLDDFNNAESKEDKLSILLYKIFHGTPEFLDRLKEIQGDRFLDDLSDDELYDLIVNTDINKYFPKK